MSSRIDYLPVEILSNIFILLHQRDKIECMTVCRQWNSIIEESCLFHTVRISHKKQIDSIIKKAKLVPHQVEKAERLILILKEDERFNRNTLNTLHLLFPNVRVYIYNGEFDLDDDDTINQIAHPRNDKIEQIAEHCSNIMTNQFLASGVCPLLTTMSIHGSNEGNDEGIGREFISLLANAPALTTLEINGFYFSLDDLELLHENLTQLTTLSLELGIIYCGGTFPIAIKPAESVNNLTFFGISLLDQSDELALYHYIRLKHPNISELQCLMHVMSIGEYDAVKAYNDGFMSLTKKLGPKLKSLHIMMDESLIDSIFELDIAGCKVKSFGFTYGSYTLPSPIEKIVQSKQANYIQSVTIDYHLMGEPLKGLKELKALRELNVAFFDEEGDSVYVDFDLNEFLTHLNDGLEKLSLSSGCLKFNLSNVCPPLPSLKSLMVSNSDIPPNLDTFVSRLFPNLSQLKFFRCAWMTEQFSLPNINLSLLEALECFSSTEEKVLITTSKERRWFSPWPLSFDSFIDTHFGYNHAPVFPFVPSFPFDKFKEEPYIEFQFNSLQTLFLTTN